MTQADAFLFGGGEMGSLIRAHDWSRTPLGATQGWPQSLRTVVRLMLNTQHPMYVFWGREGSCLYNDAYRASIGTDRHPGSLGQPARAVWGEIWDIIGPQFEQVMAGGGATWHENQLVPITRNGKREDVYWTYSYSPIDDEGAPGGIGGVLVTCTETTQQVETARRLTLSEERLQLALSGGRGIGTWDWDVVNDRVVADERFARLYGVDPVRAAQGAPVAEFFTAIHPDDLPRVRERIAVTLRTGELFSEAYRLVHPGRPECWVLAEGRCTFDAQGRPVRLPGVSFDVTDRKRIEQQLQDLNADLERKVVERALERGRTWQVSPEILGVANAQGYFETSNPAWAKVLGWSESEIASTFLFDFIHPDDQAATQLAWADLLERDLPALRFENRYRHKDGGFRWLSWVAVPDDGKVYCSARDITEDKARAQALEKAEDALRQSQKMEAVGQLTGGLAHDFNNLLMGISGNLELMQGRIAQGRTDGIDRYVGAAQSSAKRAAALTHRLLAFSRRQTLDPRPVDVNRLIAGMEDLIRHTVGPQVLLETVGAGGLWRTRVDANQLENVVLNLCINARDAMPDGGRLTVETANRTLDERAGAERDLAPGAYVSLCVTDTGTGMAPDVIAKAFDPFFTTKPLGMGTGLGLSMAYGFVRQSGGQIRIYSEPGMGTTMCLYLPRHGGGTPETEAPSAAAAPAGTGAGETLLVVEDDVAIRAMTVEVLEGAGFQVISAQDGPSGMKLLQLPTHIDLLVTDVGLPGGLNGRQLADAARVGRPGLKVLFITGYAENAVLGDGSLGAGMAVMTKPFEIDALLGRIRDILDAR